MCVRSSGEFQYCLLKRKVATCKADWESSVAYLIAKHRGWLDEIDLEVGVDAIMNSRPDLGIFPEHLQWAKP